MTRDLTTSAAYRELITELKTKIQSAQIKAALSVNTHLIGLYWEIGRLITERQKAAGWGDSVVDQIAKDLTREFVGMKGLSRRNLYYMKKVYDFYGGDDEFVQQVVAQIPWGHHVVLVDKVKEREKALWYVRETIENGWSRNVLGVQVANQLYERQAESRKIENFTGRLPVASHDLVRETMKDPYVFDFLEVGNQAKEREIESALVDRITQFMLELGKGFAFVGKQYHLEVGGEDFYIDLLFYHLKLHCYMAIELKNGPFKPEYAGKLNFYLTALDEEVKTKEDNPSIGLILCKDRNRVVAEYALRDVKKPMGVSRFELAEVLPEELRKSLPTLEEVEEEFGKEDE